MDWSLTRTVGPTVEPVSLAELKLQARIDADLTEEDELLDLYIRVATGQVENETGRQLLPATWVYRASRFPCCGVLTLPRPPLLSVTSVVYVDGAGASQTWASSNYVVQTASDTEQLSLAYGVSWPSVRSQHTAVTITYRAGYASSRLVPQPLRMAILLWAAELYKHRESTGDRQAYVMPYAVERLVWPYRLAAVLIG